MYEYRKDKDCFEAQSSTNHDDRGCLLTEIASSREHCFELRCWEGTLSRVTDLTQENGTFSYMDC
jgi:hypothetical protein